MSQEEVTEKMAILNVHLTAQVKVPVDDFNHQSAEMDREELMRHRALNKVRGSEIDYVFGGPIPRGMADFSTNDIEVVRLTD